MCIFSKGVLKTNNFFLTVVVTKEAPGLNVYTVVNFKVCKILKTVFQQHFIIFQISD